MVVSVLMRWKWYKDKLPWKSQIFVLICASAVGVRELCLIITTSRWCTVLWNTKKTGQFYSANTLLSNRWNLLLRIVALYFTFNLAKAPSNYKLIIARLYMQQTFGATLVWTVWYYISNSRLKYCGTAAAALRVE